MADRTATAALNAVFTLEQGLQAQGCHEDIVAAAAEFRSKVERALELDPAPPRSGRPHGGRWRWNVGKYRRRCCYLQKRVKKLEAAKAMLTERTSFKLDALSIVRAGLSDPSSSSRVVEEYARDYNLSDAPPFGRTSVDRVRHALARVIKRLCRAAAQGYARRAKHGFLCLRHLHDEASMRMRSFLGEAPAAEGTSEGWSRAQTRFGRSRSSKVQNNSCSLHTDASSALPWLTDLQPLGRKDSDTLCFALFCVLRDLAVTLGGDEEPCPKRRRLLHILVGDSVPTNMLAGRKLWRLIQSLLLEPPFCVLDYLMIAIRCASHQANLAVRTAIGGDAPLPKDLPSIETTSARFFKFLLVDYYEEFLANARAFVSDNFRIYGPWNLEGAALRAFERERRVSEQLQSLYGKDALPDELLARLNGGLQNFCHLAGCDGPEMDSVERGELLRVLEKYCLRTEEKPVITRFWLFTKCVQGLFRFHLLGLPVERILALPTKNPRPKNQKRIKGVTAFFQHKQTPSLLRRACLCTRLTQHVVGITGQGRARATANDQGERAGPDLPGGAGGADRRVPLLVRLASGDVIRRTSDDLRDVLRLLPVDPFFRSGDQMALCVEQLLMTAGAITIRFKQYQQYPFKLALCCQTFNPAGFRLELEAFLNASRESLDVGYSQPLQAEALKLAPAERERFLASDAIQEELRTWVSQVEGSSLEVERAHQQAKRSEYRCCLTTHRASRDMILRRYRAQGRSRKLPSTVPLRKRGSKNPERNSFWSLALKHRLAQRAGGNWAEVKKDVQQYIAENRTSLSVELAHCKEKGRLARAPDTATDPWPGVPKNAKAWVDWLDQNEAIFNEELFVVRAGQHREANFRLEAPQVYEAAPRLEASCASQARLSRPPWMRLLGNGFYTLWRPAASLRTLVFACNVMRQLWCLVFDDLEPLPQGGSAWALDVARPFFEMLLPADDALPPSLLSYLGPVQVFKNTMRVVRHSPQRIYMRALSVVLIETPPRKPKGEDNEEAGDEGEASDSSDSGEGFEVDSQGDLAEDAEIWSAASSEADVEANPNSTQTEGDDASAASDEAPDASQGLVLSDAEESALPRNPKGTHVAWETTYFTLTHDAARDVIRMRVKPSWLRRECMGESEGSKGLSRNHFAGHDDPVRCCFAVLRAWALWRMQQNRFLRGQASRMSSWRIECERLRRELREIGATTNEQAAHFLSQWAPPESMPE